MNNATLNNDLPDKNGPDYVIGAAPSPQVIQPPESAQPDQLLSTETSSPQCSKCSQALKANENVCGHCGYYETAGIYVELQKSAEAQEPAPFMWQIFLLPAVMVLIVIESMLAAYFLHPQDPDRSFLSLGHLLIGMCLFFVPHFRALFKTMKHDTNTGIIDFIGSPFRIWQIDFQELPKSFLWIFSAGVGITAILCSLIILRSLPNPFAGTGEKKETPVITLTAPSGGGGGGGSLEDAITDFTDKVKIVEGEEIEEFVDEADRNYLNCVIVGYTMKPSASDRVSSLVVALPKDDQLRIVANVSKGISPSLRVKLLHNLNKIHTDTPAVESKLPALWVRPGYRCRIWYTEKEDGKRSGMTFDRMLLIKSR